VEYIRIFVDMLRFVWFQTRSRRFITPAASPIRRMYSEVELHGDRNSIRSSYNAGEKY